MFFVPASIDEDGSVTADYDTSWGGDTAYVEFGFSGATEEETAGFNLTFANKTAFADLGNFDVEEASVWVSPLDGLTAGIGYGSDIDWSESEGFGGRDFARNLLGNCDTAAYTFDEVSNSVNSWVEYTMGGFMTAAQVGVDDADAIDTVDLFAWGDYFIGYSIENIGTIKAAFFGNSAAADRYAQAQFSLAAVDNLGLKLSGAIPVSPDDADYTAKINLAGSYAMNAATIHYYALETVADTNVFAAGLGFDYALTDTLTSVNDIRTYITDADTADSGDEDAIAGTIGVKKAFGSCEAGVAVQGNYNFETSGYEVGIPLMITISL
ncbi:MAG: hypothetical protein BKP49_03425 [Treponema sp. CETP13]|nr:MAG: hypothetical protein BKP49_03425 [Treponema sp. CETP13]